MNSSNNSGIRRSRQVKGARAMPYRTNGRRRARGASSGSFLDRPFTARQVAETSTRAFSMAKQALSLVNAEKKHFDTSGSVTPGTTPGLTCLNLIAQGDSDVTRDGLSVKFKALQLQLNINLNSTAPTFDLFRVVIFRHYQPAGVSPINALVMATTAINSFKNWHAKNLFEILYDKTFNLAPGVAVSTTDSADFKIDDLCQWNGAGGTAADLDNNGYWIMYWAVENTNKSTLGFSVRMLFYDN